VSPEPHGMAPRSPWYACVRGGFDRFDRAALAPAIQKYADADLVERLVAAPEDSLAFDPAEDVSGDGHRKLYQPHHQRFYAVTIELFCDLPGLPRPGVDDLVTVSFVTRRITDTAEQGWFLDAAGHGSWTSFEPPTESYHGPFLFTVPAGYTEPELPMTRVPTANRPAAQTRSVWFGLVPTWSGDLDGTGTPKLDASSTYVLRCLAHRARPTCPPLTSVSGPSEPFQLATFDEAGRQVPGGPAHIKELHRADPLVPVTDPLCADQLLIGSGAPGTAHRRAR
jgi:hypothetical protein